MASIDVVKTESDDRYVFQVAVREGRSTSRHKVTLLKTDYQRLSGGTASPEALVEESFRFLLEREPKESILGSFNLTVIGRYFPDYERLMRERL